jgi:iron complex outermembrane receptor protein
MEARCIYFLTVLFMKKNILFLVVCFALYAFPAFAQNASFSGRVTDNESGKPVVGANVVIKSISKGTSTDSDGYFRINNVKSGNYNVEFSYIGYKSINKRVRLSSGNVKLNIKLSRSNIGLGEVEVSAKVIRRTESSLKLAAPLKEIPLTTFTVDKDMFEQRQIVSVNEALKNATGISPTLNYGGFQTFRMRGFGAPVVMVDGQRDERMNFSNSAPLSSLASVERIEYIKGPSAVLYGHSVVGGIVNIVRKQPTNDFKANVLASYGSWDTKNVFIGLGNKLNDKIRYRFDAGLSDRKGWRSNGDKTSNVYAAVDYDISDKDILEVRLSANDDFYGTETGLPAVKYDIYDKSGSLVYKKGDLPKSFDIEQRYNDPSDFLKHENINGSVLYKHTFNNKSDIQFKASYSNDIIDYFSTEELSYLTSANPVYDNYYMKDGNKMYINLDTIQRTFPLRFSHHTKTYQHYLDYNKQFNTGSIKHKFLAGLFTMNIYRISFKGYNVGTDVKGDGLYAKVAVENPVLNQGDLTTSFSKASIYNEWVNGIYFQDLIEVTEKLNVMAGMRFDLFSMGYQTAKVKEGTELSEKSEFKSILNTSFTYRLGVLYQPVDELSVYASYSSFFKPKRSVYNENYIYIDKDGKEFTPEDGKEVFKPESGYQTELGFKYNINSKLSVNGSAYYILKNNIVEYLGKTTTGNRIYGQVGVVDSKGFELDVIWSPVKDLKLTAGYTYNDARYKEFSNNKYSKNSKVDNVMARCPQNTFFSWIYYKVNKGFFKNVNLGFGTNFRDKIYTSSNNDYELPSYWLMDATIGYTFNNITLGLKVNNIADKKHFTNTVYANQYVPGYGRNVSVSLGLKL